MKKKKRMICPECKQDMNVTFHPGLNGKKCMLCGQGLHWRKRQTKDKRSRKQKRGQDEDMTNLCYYAALSSRIL